MINTYPSTNGTTSGILALVGGFLHGTRHQTMRSEQMPLQALIGEEPVLALLTVQRRAVVDHLGVNLWSKCNALISIHVSKQFRQLP